MICRFSVENFKTFSDKVEIDFFANGNIKRLDYNHVTEGEKKILKTVGFYGPNNTGKTCILLALFNLRALMLNEPHEHFANAFAGRGDVTKFETEYCIDGRYYVYSLSYNNGTRKYEEEKLVLRRYGKGSMSNDVVFQRNTRKLTWNGIGPDLKKTNVLKLFSLSFPFMVSFDDLGSSVIRQAKKDYLRFAKSILFLKMDTPLDISKTISLMQNDAKAVRFIKEFVKNCDLHISDFGFADAVVSDVNIEEEMRSAMSNPAFIKETLKFYSAHNGYRVPSVFFDSIGTQKLIALSGYIYEALSQGKVLIVDEIDSSLHHILTRSIVAMFSNVLNKQAQLIFTTHDVFLLDLRELFRKDQIWLVDIPNAGFSTITRLSEFTARSENGIRGGEDITAYYLKGQFGSIPTPDLFSSLEEAVSNG